MPLKSLAKNGVVSGSGVRAGWNVDLKMLGSDEETRCIMHFPGRAVSESCCPFGVMEVEWLMIKH